MDQTPVPAWRVALTVLLEYHTAEEVGDLAGVDRRSVQAWKGSEHEPAPANKRALIDAAHELHRAEYDRHLEG